MAFHNTTSKYNAYFIARERIREIESAVRQSQDNNYDQILNVFPPLDSGISLTYKTQIEDAIKKASIGIQNHPNSKWVDDSYFKIYEDSTNIIETSQYL